MDVMVGLLRGLGYSVAPMVVSLAGVCGLRLVWVATVFQMYPEPASLYLSYPITWALTGLVHGLIFLAVRKRAYAVMKETDYKKVHGEHPLPERKE